MAEEIKQEFGVDSEYIKGGNGIFDVTVDGELLYSKYKKGRFPNVGEVVSIIKETK